MKTHSRRSSRRVAPRRPLDSDMGSNRDLLSLQGILLDELDRTLRDTVPDRLYWMVKNTLFSRIVARVNKLKNHT